ncbi:MAG TPA: zf-HC2 domain-containing protein [Thermoanaerobaculia bacterium]|nr:zf-HC2 domain-containing protein [Thermoanaerobaculia bacterium]
MRWLPLARPPRHRTPRNHFVTAGISPDVTCRELIDCIADYLDGGLDAETLAAFEHHVGNCQSCREYLRSYRMTMQLARLLQ